MSWNDFLGYVMFLVAPLFALLEAPYYILKVLFGW